MADIADNVPFTDPATAISQGRRHLLVRDYSMAVTALAQACELLAKKHGDTADELGEPYLLYGRALLGLAREEAGVLGGGVPGSEEAQGEEDAEDDDEDEEEGEGDEDGLNKIDEEDEEEEEEEEDKKEDEDAKKKEEGEKKEEKKADSTSPKQQQDDANDKKTRDEKDEQKVKEKMKEEKKTEEKIKDEKKTEEKVKDEKKTEEKVKDEKKAEEKVKDEKKAEEKVKDEKKAEKKVKDEKKAEEKEKGDKVEEPKADGTETKEKENASESEAKVEASSEASSSKQQNGDIQENGQRDVEDITKEDEDDEVNNLQVAWEVLELAKLVLLKRGLPGWKLLADSYRLLGEVAMEGGNHKGALHDLQGCLNLLEKIEPREPRAIAEIHYQLGLAHSLGNDFDASIEEFNKATMLLESRIKELEAITEPPKTDDPFYTVEGEIQELKDLLPEIQEKITDMKDFKQEACKMVIESIRSEIASGSSNGAGPSSSDASSSGSSKLSKPASDISHLVRKKRKVDEPEADITVPPCKKPTPEKAV